MQASEYLLSLYNLCAIHNTQVMVEKNKVIWLSCSGTWLLKSGIAIVVCICLSRLLVYATTRSNHLLLLLTRPRSMRIYTFALVSIHMNELCVGIISVFTLSITCLCASEAVSLLFVNLFCRYNIWKCLPNETTAKRSTKN